MDGPARRPYNGKRTRPTGRSGEERMRTIVATLGCVCLFTTGTASANDRDDALAVIDQAIQARGGAEALAKVHIAVRSSEGVLYQGGVEVPFTDQTTSDLPDRWREAVEIDKKVPYTVAITGDKGWQSSVGTVSDLGPERLKEMREEMYVSWLETLLPLKKDGFDLAPLPEAKVNEQPAVVVKVTSKGHADASLYFDKQTHLLVKVERMSEEAGLKLPKEYLLSDYKDFDGVKMPTRVVETLAGKKAMEVKSASYKFPSKVDDTAFAKP
jgi:hypothetical protein